MFDEYKAKFECSKRRSMDNFGFFRCPIEDYILCNAANAERCKNCHEYKLREEDEH